MAERTSTVNIIVSIAKTGTGATDAGRDLDGLKSKADRAIGSLRNFDSSSKVAWQSILQTGRAANMSTDDLGALATSMGVASQSQVQAKLKMDQLISSWSQGRISSGQLAAGMKELDAQNEGAAESTGRLSSAAGQLRGVITAAAVVGVAKMSFELAELGAQSLRTRTAFENISGGADEAAIRLAAMQRATRGAVSETTQMALANRLMQMGLANNAQELEKVTSMAIRLGTAMGRNATQSVEEFSLLLANQSIPRLDTFGISAGTVRTRINELQAATADMTREEAFMIATFEEGEAAMERLGEATDDTALSFERARARIEDAKVAIGEGLAPVWASILEVVAKGIGIITDWNKAVNEAKEEQSGLLRVIGFLIPPIGFLATGIGILNNELDENEKAALRANAAMGEEYAQGLGIATTATQEIVPPVNDASRGMFDLATSTSTVAKAFLDLDLDPEALFNLAAASGASTEELAALAQQMGLADDAQIDMALATFQLVERFGAGTISAGELATGFGLLQEAGARAAESVNTVGLEVNALPARKRIEIEIAVSAGRETAASRAGIPIPTFQAGGRTPGGDILVGERGPEIVRLPVGAQVTPTNRIDQSRTINRGGDTFIITDPMGMALASDRLRRDAQTGIASGF